LKATRLETHWQAKTWKPHLVCGTKNDIHIAPITK